MNKILIILFCLSCFGVHDLCAQYHCIENKMLCQDTLTGIEEYNILNSINNSSSQNQLYSRSDYTHKIDSSYTWSLEDGIEVITLKAEYILDKFENSELILVYDNQSANLTSIDWVPESYFFETFNDEGLLTIETFSFWDGSSEFNHDNASLIRRYSYDDENRLILSETLNQNDIINNKINNSNIYHYDSLGYPTGISRYFWFDNVDTITHVKETEYNYNENQLLESIVNYAFDLDIGWEPDDSTFFKYNNQGIKTEEFRYNWIKRDINSYQPSYKNIYHYDENLKLTRKEIYHTFDREKDEFRYKDFLEYTYHEYGSLEKEVYFLSGFYDPRDIISETTYSHHTDILTQKALRPKGSPLNNINLHNEKYVLFEHEKYIDMDYGYRDLDYRIQSFYSEIDPVSTTDPVISNTDLLNVSPNPAADFIQFDWEGYSGELEVTLYNITGQKISSIYTNNHNDVDLTEYNAGIYFYTVRNGDKIVSGRFVKV